MRESEKESVVVTSNMFLFVWQVFKKCKRKYSSPLQLYVHRMEIEE